MMIESYIMSQDVFSALADVTRRRILELLRAGERSAGELVLELGMEQTAVSKHLRTLRDAGLVDVRPEGRYRLYRLRPAELEHAHRWLASLLPTER